MTIIVNQALLDEQQIQACQREIDKTLQKYGCVLHPVVELSPAGMRSKVMIVLVSPLIQPIPPNGGER